MEKYQKYFLSFFAISCIGCIGKSKEQNSKTQKAQAAKILNHEYSIHNFDGYMQGSPKSMTLLDSILKLDSTNAAAWREISIPYLKRGIPHKWKPLFDRAVYHDPETWQPWRGYLYLWFYRDYKKAIADFNATDTLTPHIDYPQGHSVDFWRGIAYLGLKDYENSLYYWNKHIAKETSDSGEDWVELEAFLYRGIAYYESGNSNQALENFDKIIQYFNQSADAKYYKSLILMEKGDIKQAKDFVEEAILDYHSGYYNNRPYVETLRQLYPQDLQNLKQRIINAI